MRGQGLGEQSFSSSSSSDYSFLGEQFADCFKADKAEKLGGYQNQMQYESEADAESRRSGDMGASLASKHVLKDNDIEEENWNQ